MKPNQKRKQEFLRIVREIWAEDPSITIKDMLRQPAIIEASRKNDGDFYKEATVRKWIRELSTAGFA